MLSCKKEGLETKRKQQVFRERGTTCNRNMKLILLMQTFQKLEVQIGKLGASRKNLDNNKPANGGVSAAFALEK